MIRRLLARLLRRHDEPLDEVCRTCFCDLTVRTGWQVVEHLANTAEMGAMGGTYMTAYYCHRHRPVGAQPVDH